jgi:hypothetical protein
VLLARWFLTANTAIDPDVLIRPDDHELGDLLVVSARGDRGYEAILALFALGRVRRADSRSLRPRGIRASEHLNMSGPIVASPRSRHLRTNRYGRLTTRSG